MRSPKLPIVNARSRCHDPEWPNHHQETRQTRGRNNVTGSFHSPYCSVSSEPGGYGDVTMESPVPKVSWEMKLFKKIMAILSDYDEESFWSCLVGDLGDDPLIQIGGCDGQRGSASSQSASCLGSSHPGSVPHCCWWAQSFVHNQRKNVQTDPGLV